MQRIALPLGFVLVLATSAWAQLATQTALVGTVTDRDGDVVRRRSGASAPQETCGKCSWARR